MDDTNILSIALLTATTIFAGLYIYAYFTYNPMRKYFSETKTISSHTIEAVKFSLTRKFTLFLLSLVSGNNAYVLSRGEHTFYLLSENDEKKLRASKNINIKELKDRIFKEVK